MSRDTSEPTLHDSPGADDAPGSGAGRGAAPGEATGAAFVERDGAEVHRADEHVGVAVAVDVARAGDAR